MKRLPRISLNDPVRQLRYDSFRIRVGIAWIRIQLAWNRFKQFIYCDDRDSPHLYFFRFVARKVSIS